MKPDAKNFDRYFKLAICGAAGTGKRTVLQSFSTEGDEENIWTTLTVDDERILIQGDISKIWTKEMSQKYDAVVITFATDDYSSFEYALELLNEITKTNENIPIVVIENKIDIVEKSEVKKEKVESEMKIRKKRLYRVSSIKEFNVMHPFAYLIEKLTRRKKRDENANERITENALFL